MSILVVVIRYNAKSFSEIYPLFSLLKFENTYSSPCTVCALYEDYYMSEVYLWCNVRINNSLLIRLLSCFLWLCQSKETNADIKLRMDIQLHTIQYYAVNTSFIYILTLLWCSI